MVIFRRLKRKKKGAKFGVYKLQNPIAVHVIDKYCLCALFVTCFQCRQSPLYIFV
jgi:hypothetical protein